MAYFAEHLMIDKNKLQNLKNGKGEVEIDDPVILIRINRTYKKNMSERELYEATRKAWRLNPERANGAKYVFSVYKGTVKEIYEMEFWKFSKIENGRKRYEFNGRVASNGIRAKYWDMSVAKVFKKGASNPITYINC